MDEIWLRDLETAICSNDLDGAINLACNLPDFKNTKNILCAHGLIKRVLELAIDEQSKIRVEMDAIKKIQKYL